MRRIASRLVHRSRLVRVVSLAVLGPFFCNGCAHKSSERVTLTLLDQGWISREFVNKRAEVFKQFTSESGIEVKVLPIPETSLDQLAFWKKLLAAHSQTPDVYGVDVIWPAELEDDLLDLQPELGQEVAAHFPALVEKYRVHGKLVAIPYHANLGVLFCRKDLLLRYGYRRPPESWSELEQMARRIQSGERARGNREFWGFVWEGEPSEGLTCNALEWQAAEGGGQIIESDGSISVNNPLAIRAWERAAHWVGTISPPGVVAYRESDANNIWLQGQAAFMRNWTPSYRTSQAASSPLRDKVEIALLPRDAQGHTGTLGGSGLGISRYSQHPREAVALIRFLCRADVQKKWAEDFSEPPTLPELYSSADLLAANPYLSQLKGIFDGRFFMRPAQIAGRNYDQVSSAYIQAVHSVLIREVSGAQAARALEKKLVEITSRHAMPAKGSNAR